MTKAKHNPNRVVALSSPYGVHDIPTRPGPFTIGGPEADVCIPGLQGIAAIGEVQANGALRITPPSLPT